MREGFSLLKWEVTDKQREKAKMIHVVMNQSQNMKLFQLNKDTDGYTWKYLKIDDIDGYGYRYGHGHGYRYIDIDDIDTDIDIQIYLLTLSAESSQNL